QHLVLYRNEQNQPVVLEDFCPHRGLPLSKGFIKEGKITCGYHGMVVNCDGSCHSMVGQDVSRFRGIRAYPTHECYGFIWIWLGDPAQADPSLISDLNWADSDDWAYGGDYYHMACDYRLLIGNLM